MPQTPKRPPNFTSLSPISWSVETCQQRENTLGAELAKNLRQINRLIKTLNIKISSLLSGQFVIEEKTKEIVWRTTKNGEVTGYKSLELFISCNRQIPTDSEIAFREAVLLNFRSRILNFEISQFSEMAETFKNIDQRCRKRNKWRSAGV